LKFLVRQTPAYSRLDFGAFEGRKSFAWFTRLIVISKQWLCHQRGFASLISRGCQPAALLDRKADWPPRKRRKEENCTWKEPGLSILDGGSGWVGYFNREDRIFLCFLG
jgi:hypothetical protein